MSKDATEALVDLAHFVGQDVGQGADAADGANAQSRKKEAGGPGQDRELKKYGFRNYVILGSGGGASGHAAAGCPDDTSLILLGAGLFSLSIKQWRFLIQVPHGGATFTDFPKKSLSCAP